MNKIIGTLSPLLIKQLNQFIILIIPRLFLVLIHFVNTCWKERLNLIGQIGAKMKIYLIVLGVLCVGLVGKCQEVHHIEQRVLENKTTHEIPLTKSDAKIYLALNDTKVLSSSGNSQTTTVASLDSKESDVLEQELDAWASSPPLTSNTVQSNKTGETPAVRKPETQNKKTDKENSSKVPDVKDPLYVGIVPNISITEIPEVFPNDTNILLDDKEKLKRLLSHNTTGNIYNYTEAKDLVNKTIRALAATYELNQHPLEPHEPIQMADGINDDTELIENGKNTEDQIRNHKKLTAEDGKSKEDEDGLQQRYLAAILVSLLVAVSVLCYAALLTWRRYLERRYGSRTMLVNEEDFDDPSDLRHFSI